MFRGQPFAHALADQVRTAVRILKECRESHLECGKRIDGAGRECPPVLQPYRQLQVGGGHVGAGCRSPVQRVKGADGVFPLR